MGMKEEIVLNEVASLSFIGDAGISFCINLTKKCDYLNVLTKTDSIILQNKYSQICYQTDFNIDRFKIPCSKFVPSKTISVDESAVFNDANLAEKRELQLNQLLLPNCSIPHIQSLKSEFSPYNEDNPLLLAYLNSFGALIIYSKESTGWNQVMNISEIRAAAFNLNIQICRKYKQLKESVNRIVFQNFEWSSSIFGVNTRYLVTNTKDGALLFYGIKYMKKMKSIDIDLKYSEKMVNLKICSYRWVESEKRHFLFISSDDGSLTVFSLNIHPDGRFESLNRSDPIAGLNIAASFMAYHNFEHWILILCAKTHSVEAYLFDPTGQFRSGLVQYMCIAITGIQHFLGNTFFFSSLDGKVYQLDFYVSGNNLSCGSKKLVENHLTSDRYLSYGLAASKNRALVYQVLYPKSNFDHLSLRQPLTLAIYSIPSRDPFEMLLKNKHNQLTDYYDCIELVRYLGTKDINVLAPLEFMPFEVETTTKFLYFLKLQLIVHSAKLTFYKRRSNDLHEAELKTFESFAVTTEVLKCYFLLKSILKENPSQMQEIKMLTARCIRNFFMSFLKMEFEQEFKLFQVSLKSELEKIISMVSFLDTLPLRLERCSYCQEEIESNQLTCRNNHLTSRCCITKLQVPLFTSKLCSACKRVAHSQDVLEKVTSKNLLLMMCPTCDLCFEIN